MKNFLAKTPVIGKGKYRYSMTAAVICEDSTLRSETLTVAADNKRASTKLAAAFVHDNWAEADHRLDYRVEITAVERMEGQ